MNPGSVAGLVLAAGAGRRFGRPKALVRLSGLTLLERAANVLVNGGCALPVQVVLGCPLDEPVPLSDQLRVGWNPMWREGIGSSLRCGLEAVEATSAEAVVVVLVDQPEIAAAAVNRVISAYERGGRAASAVVATYGGHRDHPVLLGREVWPTVRVLAVGDVGARGFMATRADLVTEVVCDGLGRPDDVDTPADLDLASQRLGLAESPTAGPGD